MEKVSTPSNRLTRSSAKNTPSKKSNEATDHSEPLKSSVRRTRRKTDSKISTHCDGSNNTDTSQRSLDDIGDGHSLDGFDSEDSNVSSKLKISPHLSKPSRRSLRTRRSITPGPEAEPVVPALRKMRRSMSEGKLETTHTPTKRRSTRAVSESKDFVFTPTKQKSSEKETESSELKGKNIAGNTGLKVLSEIIEEDIEPDCQNSPDKTSVFDSVLSSLTVNKNLEVLNSDKTGHNFLSVSTNKEEEIMCDDTDHEPQMSVESDFDLDKINGATIEKAADLKDTQLTLLSPGPNSKMTLNNCHDTPTEIRDVSAKTENDSTVEKEVKEVPQQITKTEIPKETENSFFPDITIKISPMIKTDITVTPEVEILDNSPQIECSANTSLTHSPKRETMVFESVSSTKSPFRTDALTVLETNDMLVNEQNKNHTSPVVDTNLPAPSAIQSSLEPAESLSMMTSSDSLAQVIDSVEKASEEEEKEPSGVHIDKDCGDQNKSPTKEEALIELPSTNTGVSEVQETQVEEKKLTNGELNSFEKEVDDRIVFDDSTIEDETLKPLNEQNLVNNQSILTLESGSQPNLDNIKNKKCKPVEEDELTDVEMKSSKDERVNKNDLSFVDSMMETKKLNALTELNVEINKTILISPTKHSKDEQVKVNDPNFEDTIIETIKNPLNELNVETLKTIPISPTKPSKDEQVKEIDLIFEDSTIETNKNPLNELNVETQKPIVISESDSDEPSNHMLTILDKHPKKESSYKCKDKNREASCTEINLTSNEVTVSHNTPSLGLELKSLEQPMQIENTLDENESELIETSIVVNDQLDTFKVSVISKDTFVTEGKNLADNNDLENNCTNDSLVLQENCSVYFEDESSNTGIKIVEAISLENNSELSNSLLKSSFNTESVADPMVEIIEDDENLEEIFGDSNSKALSEEGRTFEEIMEDDESIKNTVHRQNLESKEVQEKIKNVIKEKSETAKNDNDGKIINGRNRHTDNSESEGKYLSKDEDISSEELDSCAESSELYKNMSDFGSDISDKKDDSEYSDLKTDNSEDDNASLDEDPHNEETNIENILDTKEVENVEKSEENKDENEPEKQLDTSGPMTYDKALAILNKDRDKKIDDEEFFDMFTQELNRVSEESGSDSDIAIVDEYIAEPDEQQQNNSNKKPGSSVQTANVSKNPTFPNKPFQKQALPHSGGRTNQIQIRLKKDIKGSNETIPKNSSLNSYDQHVQSGQIHPNMEKMVSTQETYYQYIQGQPPMPIREVSPEFCDPENMFYHPINQMQYSTKSPLRIRNIESMQSPTNQGHFIGQQPRTTSEHGYQRAGKSTATMTESDNKKDKENLKNNSLTKNSILEILGLDKKTFKMLKRALGVDQDRYKQKTVMKEMVMDVLENMGVKIKPSQFQNKYKTSKKVTSSIGVKNKLDHNSSNFSEESSVEDSVETGPSHALSSSSSEESSSVSLVESEATKSRLVEKEKNRAINLDDGSVSVTFQTRPKRKARHYSKTQIHSNKNPMENISESSVEGSDLSDNSSFKKHKKCKTDDNLINTKYERKARHRSLKGKAKSEAQTIPLVMQTKSGTFYVEEVMASTKNETQRKTEDSMCEDDDQTDLESISDKYKAHLKRSLKKELDSAVSGKNKLSNMFSQRTQMCKRKADKAFEENEEEVPKVTKSKRIPADVLSDLLGEVNKPKKRKTFVPTDSESEEMPVLRRNKSRNHKQAKKLRVSSAVAKKEYIPLVTSGPTQFGLQRLDKDGTLAAIEDAKAFRTNRLYGSPVRRITIMDFDK